MILVVTILLFLTAVGCGKDDKQHADGYKDDEMIGTVNTVKPEENRITVDISEWVKRDAGDVTTDEGYGISPQVTDKTVIEDENGNSASLSEIKEGQKVLINPPEGAGFKGEAEEIILLDMSNEEKYAGILSHLDDKLNIVIMYEKEEPPPFDLEDIFSEVSGDTVGRSMPYPENHVVDYKEELDIETFPVIMVFNDKELLFKGYNPEEIIHFFEEL